MALSWCDASRHYLVQPEGERNNSFFVSSPSKHLMLVGVLVKVCLPVILGFIDSLQVSLPTSYMSGMYENLVGWKGEG